MEKRKDMYTTNLRKVGGSAMLAVPPAVMELLDLEPGQTLALSVDGDRIILERKLERKKPRSRYTLADLLSQCDPNAPLPEGDREWLDSGSHGRELL